MFDIDSLEQFSRPAAQEQKFRVSPAEEVSAAIAAAAGGYPVARSSLVTSQAATSQSSEGAPKSREERLREFYARREQGSQLGEKPEQSVVSIAAGQSISTSHTAVSETGARSLLPRGPPTAEAEAETLQLKKRGNDLYQSRDYEAAVEQYSSALKKAPSSMLYSNRAAAYMMLGWWDQALRDTRAALRKDPANERALERHGRVLLAQDQLDDVLRVAADLEARTADENQSAGSAKQLSQSLRRMRWLAQHAKGEPSTLEDCRAVLNEFGGTKAELASPLGFRLRRTMCRRLMERSDTIDNHRKIRPALPRNRRPEGGDADAGEIQEITPLAEEALQITAELLADNPEDADVRYLRSKALVRLGRHGEAEQQLQRGLEANPEHEPLKALDETISELDNLKGKGNSSYKEGNMAEAIRWYSLGLEKDPGCTDTRTCATLHFNRASAHRRSGDFEQALQDSNLALNLHPKWCKALYRRGILLLECGRYAEALTELKVVQRADPTFDDDLEDWLRRAHNWLAKPQGEINYYRLMRLPMDSSKDDIKKQYRRLCLLWHPDKSDGTEAGRQKFDDLQEAYRFLMDDVKREKYDYGIWKDKTVRHHVKRREKVKNTWDDAANNEEKMPFWYDEQLLDEKVECIYWGADGPPAWLREKREQFNRSF